MSTLLITTLIHFAFGAQEQVSTHRLCELADRVVVAEVTSIHTQWEAGKRGGIERIASINSSETLKGDSASGIELTLPGGALNGLTHWIEDVPELAVDARYILFIKNQSDGRFTVIGGDQGALSIPHDERANVAIQAVALGCAP